MKVSWKKGLMMALAYVGVVIGAGFASGQEIMQYYVSYSGMGFWGLVLSTIIFIVGGLVLLQLGSFYLAREHSDVIERITHPAISKIIDLFINLTLFLFGFVMIAGGGSSLNQQFGLPVWVGSGLLALLIYVTSYLDVSKITNVIGMITPFVIIFIVLTSIYTLMTVDISFSEALQVTAEQPKVLPNWFISALNYSALALMIAISMAFVIGGGEYNPRQAGISGAVGGLIVSVLLFISYFALTAGIEQVQGSAMPMLALVDSIHPTLGAAMSVVIFGMIYNTSIGLYYPLAKRMSKAKPKRFRIYMLLIVVGGFILSFFGFETLVSTVYPFIGYFGILVIALLVWQWFKYRKYIREEEGYRRTMLDYALDKIEVSQDKVVSLMNKSPVNNERLVDETRARAKNMEKN